MESDSVALLLEWLMDLAPIKIKSSYMMSNCLLDFINKKVYWHSVNLCNSSFIAKTQE